MRQVKRKSQYKKTFADRVDDLVGVFSPKWALQRKAYRDVLSVVSYKGADRSRLRGSWMPNNVSADAALLRHLSFLRDRSRDLNRNDPYASGVTETIVSNVVGTGIRPQSRIDRESLGVDEDFAIDFQKKAERSWQRWVSFADVGERLNFYDIQELVERQILESGEAIVIPVGVKREGHPYTLALQIVEPDRLDTPHDLRHKKNIRSGVEIGEHGEPIAYYIRQTHPGDYNYSYTSDSKKFIRYPAKNEFGRPNVLHLYWMKRPGQTRGEPFFAPVMTYFKDLSEYMEAELIAARVAACFSAIIKKTNPYEASIGRATSKNDKSQRLETLEPGTFEYLEPGEDITQVNPTRPGGTFEPFIEVILRGISSGLNLPYEIVAKDFSRTNYSSARSAILEARKYFQKRQEFISRKLCQPVWEMLLEDAYLAGELPEINFYDQRLDWTRCHWIAPGWSWVDPTKEVTASRSSVEGNLSTLADEAASHGKDWEEILDQRAREKKKMKELGIEEVLVSKSSSKPNQNDDEKDDETEDTQKKKTRNAI